MKRSKMIPLLLVLVSILGFYGVAFSGEALRAVLALVRFLIPPLVQFYMALLRWPAIKSH